VTRAAGTGWFVALGYGALSALACDITLVATREPRPTRPAEQPATA
jgi:hypothetical protein